MWWLGCAPGIAGPVLLYLTAQVPGWAVEVGALHEVCLVVFGHPVFPGPHFSLVFRPFLHGYIGRSGLQTAWASIWGSMRQPERTHPVSDPPTFFFQCWVLIKLLGLDFSCTWRWGPVFRDPHLCSSKLCTARGPGADQSVWVIGHPDCVPGYRLCSDRTVLGITVKAENRNNRQFNNSNDISNS